MFIPDEEAARLIEAWAAASVPGLCAGVWPGWTPERNPVGVVLPGGAGLCVRLDLPFVGRAVAARSGGATDGVRHLTWEEAAAAGLPVGGGARPVLRGLGSDGVVAVRWGGGIACFGEGLPADPVRFASLLHARAFALWWSARALAPGAAEAQGASSADDAPQGAGGGVEPEPIGAEPEPIGGEPERAALLAVEGRLLLAALREVLPGNPEPHATSLALLRRERRAELDDAAIDAERRAEVALGLPMYVGRCCAARLPGGQGKGAGADQPPTVPQELAAGLGALGELPWGRRTSAAGWALAELLQRMEAESGLPPGPSHPRPWAGRVSFPEGWREALTSGRACDFDALLEAQARFDGGSRDDAALRAAKDAYGHAEALREARERSAEADIARRALIDRIFRGEGTLLVFDVRQLGAAHVRAPAPAQAVHAGMAVYPRGATFVYGSGARIECDGLPLAEDRRSGLLQARVRAPLALRGDGGRLAQPEGVFEQGLDLRLPGLRVLARRGHLRPIDGGVLIHLTR